MSKDSNPHEEAAKQEGKKDPGGKPQAKGYAFRTFNGVFTPSLLTILGVIMYLRFGWVLGNVGLAKTLLIVTMSTAITFITALSISELATNMRIGGGGAYFIISRCLGLEAGGAIGLPLFLAKAISISFYIAGFTESVCELFPSYSPFVVSCLTLMSLTLVAYLSADAAIKVQFLILILIGASLLSFFVGAFSVPVLTDPAMNISVTPNSFWVVFAVFFPAVTGIEAGLSMSGDLKNPERSLPLGTLAAVGVSYVVYLAIPVVLFSIGVDRYSLISSPLIMKDVARWGPLVIAGLWGATLSSALGSLLGAPRTLQALAQDRVIPGWIGVGYGKKNDPRIATVIAAGIALLGISLGDLNLIAPLLTMFFLTTYGLINCSAALEGLISNPSWRPKFRVHWTLPALGAAGCLCVMLMINAGATMLATAVSGFVYYLMAKRNMRAYWGDLRYGILMLVMRLSVHGLSRIKPHGKTWRPNLLVFSGAPASHWSLIALADAISHGKGFLTAVTVVPKAELDGDKLESLRNSISQYLAERGVPAIVKVLAQEDMLEGARSVLQSYGFGPLVPNTVLLGATFENENFDDFAKLVITASRLRRNVIIVREWAKKTEPEPGGRIDIWWREKGENAGLMLALAYLLKTSPEWLGSTLTIKTIVEDSGRQAEMKKHLESFTKHENMQAGVQVYVADPDKDGAFQQIRGCSRGASLVLLGLRSPGKTEESEDYSRYYQALLQNTADFPPTALVLSAEKIDFDAIFQLREGV